MSTTENTMDAARKLEARQKLQAQISLIIRARKKKEKCDITVNLSNVNKILRSLTIAHLKCDLPPVREFDPTARTACEFISLDEPLNNKSIAYLLNETHDIKDVEGDGNCAGYCSILALQLLGKLPAERLETNEQITATLLKLRQVLVSVLENEGAQMWKGIPKEDDGSVIVDYFVLNDLHPDTVPYSKTTLWHKSVKPMDYVRHIRYCPEEHISELGLMALAVFYEVTIVIISLQAHKEFPQPDDYRTLIMDATNYSATKQFRVEAAPGIKIISKEKFPNTIELFLSYKDTAHVQFLWRREEAKSSDDFPTWAYTAQSSQQQSSTSTAQVQAPPQATTNLADVGTNQAVAAQATAELQHQQAEAERQKQATLAKQRQEQQQSSTSASNVQATSNATSNSAEVANNQAAATQAAEELAEAERQKQAALAKLRQEQEDKDCHETDSQQEASTVNNICAAFQRIRNTPGATRKWKVQQAKMAYENEVNELSKK